MNEAKPQPRATVEPRFRSRDVTALLLLPFGGFIYLVGWAAGVALLWTSDRWTTTEKWLGTLVLPFGLLPILMLGSFAGRVCRGTPTPGQTGCTGAYFPGWFDIPVLAALIAAQFLVLAYLIKNARPNRSLRDQPVTR
jgi:hypothetical protein